MNKEQLIEQVKVSAISALTAGKGKITDQEIKKELKNNLGIENEDVKGNENEGWQVKIDGKVIYISNVGEVKEIIDRTGIKEGDYVQYSVGNWTQEEIDSLGSLYSGETIPTSNNKYQFGGFKVGQSKDVGIVKGEENVAQSDMEHSGWRVLKINLDASLDLIHAGAPEYYYHPTRYPIAKADIYKLAGNVARSKYILEGGEKDENTELEFAYEGAEVRKLTMYENNDFVVEGSAHIVSLDEIAKKDYQGPGTQWQRIIGKSFWTVKSYYKSAGGIFCCTYYSDSGKASLLGYGRDVALGIRPVVKLKPDCVLKDLNEENITTHNTPDTAWGI